MPLDLQTRAEFRPATLDRKARTVELILSTGASVERWDMSGRFLEQLEISERAVDLSRLPVPLLDGHRQDGVESILGVVESARIEAGQLVGKVRLSARQEALLDDIEAGIITSVSIGYQVEKVAEHTDNDGRKVRKVIRWQLMEASFVSVAADPKARVRSSEMDTQTTTAAQAVTTTTPPAAQTRAQVNAEIRALARTVNLGAAEADTLIDREATVEEARAELMAIAQRRQNTTPIVTAMHPIDSPTAVRTRMAEAVVARCDARHKPSEAARPFMEMTLVDMLRDLGIRAGHFSTTTPINEMLQRMHVTPDFPLLLGDTMNRVMQSDYQAAPATLKATGRQSTNRDFRARTKIKLSEAATLLPQPEGAEVQYSTLEEAKETIKLDTYARGFVISRQAIINDDLGAFNDMARKWGQAAVEFEGQFLVDMIVKNSGVGPTMDDGKALFHADHGNLAGSAAAITEASLGLARKAMRLQKGLTGKPINVTPKYLVVHPAKETEAEKVLAAIQPTKTADVNPFAGSLQLLVDARLPSETRWYVSADPAQIDGLEYCYLQGEEGPQVFTEVGFDVDGVKMKVRLDFGAAFLDWRGWYMNPGA
jgi:phage head maturation protease